jgi:hypothetical protein
MPFPSAAEVQGVPATPSAQANGGLDIASLIQNISLPFPQGLTQSATTPVQGGHAMQVPSSLQQPIGPHQDRPMDQRQVVGRKAAKLQGIGNAITGATNAIGAVVTKEAQIKQNEIKDSALKLIQSQQMIDEAKQQLESAQSLMQNSKPDDPAQAQYKAMATKAQEMIDQNTKTKEAILADPKRRKELVKGFDISYTDPESNKTPAHMAAMSAMKEAHSWQEKRQIMKEEQQRQNEARGKVAGEAFAKGQPQGMAANVLAQNQIAAIQNQNKERLETVKALGPLWVEKMRAEGNLNVAEVNKAADLRKAAIEADSKIDTQLLKNKQDDKNNAASLSLEAYRKSADRSLEMLKQGNPVEVLKAFNESQKNYETAITENQKSRQALNNELDKASASRGAEIRRQLQSMDAMDEQAKNAFTLNRNVIAKGLGVDVTDSRLQIPTVKVGEGVQSGGAASTSTTPSTDLDPRTGAPWKSGVSTTDRLLIKAHYGEGILSHNVEQTVDSVNKDARKLERFFDPDKSKSD